MKESSYKNIYVLDCSAIGDLVMLIPFLKSLRAAIPKSVLSMGVSEFQLPIAKTLEGKVLDNVDSTKVPVGIPQRIMEMGYSIGRVKKSDTDVLITTAGGYRNSLVSLVSGAQVRINPHADTNRPLTSLAYTHNIAHPFLRHPVDRHLSILEYLGFRSSGEINFDFPIPDEVASEARQLADNYCISSGAAVALNPISGSRWKNWPVKNMLSIIDVLSKDFGYRVVIFGKESSPVPISGEKIVDLRGKTGLLIDAYLQRYSGLFSLVIGVDTGMMHIAGSVNSDREGSYQNASGNRTISLFGPTDPRMYRPYDPTNRFNVVVQPDVSNIKRNHSGYMANWENGGYMNNITPRMVLDKVEYLKSIKAA